MRFTPTLKYLPNSCRVPRLAPFIVGDWLGVFVAVESTEVELKLITQKIILVYLMIEYCFFSVAMAIPGRRASQIWLRYIDWIGAKESFLFDLSQTKSFCGLLMFSNTLIKFNVLCSLLDPIDRDCDIIMRRLRLINQNLHFISTIRRRKGMHFRPER